MPFHLPSADSLKLSIDNGTKDDYHLVRLYSTWYSGWFYRHRLRMIDSLFGAQRLSRVLEVGVGSGIFVPQLLSHAEHVTGIDIHASFNGVRQMLQAEGVPPERVELRQGSILDIPFPDGSFDAVVCISVLEHFADSDAPLRELARVVTPGGFLALGFPARTEFTDSLFKLLGHPDPRVIHPASHTQILAAIRDLFEVETVSKFPSPLWPMYVAVKARPR
jgi:ubiquinone/menaquinone biosynthesis C-methylase UbiE